MVGVVLLALVLVTACIVRLVRAGRRYLANPYPELDRRTQQLWQQAGATRPQLAVLNDLQGIRKSLPPVGYGDRRTLANPVADAYAIMRSSAWSDPWLADRQLTIDPVAEAYAITESFGKITSLLRTADLRMRMAPPASATRQAYAGHVRTLRLALDETLKRSAALSRYRFEVERLAEVLADRRGLVAAEVFSEQVLDVVSESVQHEFATRHLEDSRAQLRQVETTLHEITAILTGRAQAWPGSQELSSGSPASTSTAGQGADRDGPASSAAAA